MKYMELQHVTAEIKVIKLDLHRSKPSTACYNRDKGNKTRFT
jgi:hypothetical protein